MPKYSTLLNRLCTYRICSNRSRIQIDAGPIQKLEVYQVIKSINAGSPWINTGCQLWAWQFNVYLTSQRGVASRSQAVKWVLAHCSYLYLSLSLLFNISQLWEWLKHSRNLLVVRFELYCHFLVLLAGRYFIDAGLADLVLTQSQEGNRSPGLYSSKYGTQVH